MPLMRTHNEVLVHAPLGDCVRAASDVESWPVILPHYRRVFFTRKDGPGRGRVRMEAYRHFGRLPYPIWWESEMVTHLDEAEVRYRHVDGITTRMDVLWKLEERGGGTHITILHEWDGPRWPLIGAFAARAVIGPRFIHVVAGRTLAGIKRAVEARNGHDGERLTPGVRP
jgi:hypothetical protein